MPRNSKDAPENEYDAFVVHPRYGRRPRITGLNPKPFDPDVHLHWCSVTYKEYKAEYGASWTVPDMDSYRPIRRIPNTAIVADLERQTPATIPVTHYFDLALECRDCKRPFIFFAEEQKHWYEELGFGLDSQCIWCVECRKKEQGVARHRETYERLFHVDDRDAQQNLEMAEACLALIEAGVFHRRKTETVRMLLNAALKDAEVREGAHVAGLQQRLLVVAAGSST